MPHLILIRGNDMSKKEGMAIAVAAMVSIFGAGATLTK
jgi:hypothetical protein